MYERIIPKQFTKDYKKAAKSNKDLKKLHFAMSALANNKKLGVKYKDHKLKGNYTGFRECHIEPDWLLIYKIDKQNNVIIFARTGTHSDLFD